MAEPIFLLNFTRKKKFQKVFIFIIIFFLCACRFDPFRLTISRPPAEYKLQVKKQYSTDIYALLSFLS